MVRVVVFMYQHFSAEKCVNIYSCQPFTKEQWRVTQRRQRLEGELEKCYTLLVAKSRLQNC